MDLLPLQAWWRLLQEYRLGFHTCSCQFIVLIDIEYNSSSSAKASFVDSWSVFLHQLDHRSLILILILRCVRKVSMGRIQNGSTYLLPPQAWGRYGKGCRFAWFHVSSSIDLLSAIKPSQVNPVNFCVNLISQFNFRVSFETHSLLKFIQVWYGLSVVKEISDPRGNKFHWDNHYQLLVLIIVGIVYRISVFNSVHCFVELLLRLKRKFSLKLSFSLFHSGFVLIVICQRKSWPKVQ